MAIKIGINGFGRIGRVVLRILAEDPEQYEICGINLRKADVDYMVYLLKYDSVQGNLDMDIHAEGDQIMVEAAAQVVAEECAAAERLDDSLVEQWFGHRNDVEGYAAALESFDSALPRIIGAMKEGDILMITADHGCDPTTPSTDHSREYIPLVVAGKHVKANVNLGTRKTFADIGATVFDYLTGEQWNVGESFLNDIYED